jgi:hypothetical protein|tara:strand:+ start:216 stop:545 length:330 start_codon:yes stop_codon:yes gene_type:complete
MGGTVRQATTSVSSDSTISVGTAGSTVLAANNNRASLSVQNVGTTKVYIRFNQAVNLGAGGPDYSFILAPASGTNEGDGGVLSIDNFTGTVYAKTASGSSTVVATEFIH